MKRILIITLALVFGLSAAGLAAGTFSGRWASVMFVAPQIPEFDVISVLTVDYRLAGWRFGSVSILTTHGWIEQDFRADGALGAFTLTNYLRFNPTEPAFTFLQSTAAVALAGVDFETRFLIVEDGSGLRLRVGGRVDDHLPLVRATAYFGSLAFDPLPWDWWEYVPVMGPWGVMWEVLRPDLWWEVPWEAPWELRTHDLTFRGLDVDIEMRFYSFMLEIDADFVCGFEDLTLTVPAFPLGIPGFTLGAEVTYTLDAKTVALTPHITVGEWVHFQPFLSVGELGEGGIEALVLEGLRLTWAVDERVTFIYEWDSRAWVAPYIAGHGYRQRIRINAVMEPIRFYSAFAWWDYDYDVMPMFPQDIDLVLSAAMLPALSLRTGVHIADHELYALSFGFTVDW